MRVKTTRLLPCAAAMAGPLLLATAAQAQVGQHPPLPTLPPIVREEPAVPRFLVPNDNQAEDYQIDWLGEPIPDVTLSIEPNSLQWVRADGVLRLPRGRVVVKAKSIEGGTVRAAGFVQTLSRVGEEATVMGGESPPGEADGSARMLVPLLSGDGNPIDVTVLRGGVEISGTAVIRFAPREPHPVPGGRIYVDTTCSPYNVRYETSGGRDDELVYIGCRNVTALAQSHRTSSLEIVVFWDNVGRSISVDGVVTDSGGDNVWNMRASSSPGFIELFAGDHRIALRYAVSPHPRKASLGIGIGPYWDTFRGTGPEDRETVEPLVTLYGSYAISPWSRIVLFNATPLREDTYSDTGFYLQKRTSDTLDRRVSANVFLGGHVLFFTADDPFDDREGKTIIRRFGAPQGAEFLVRDVGFTGWNVIAGGLTDLGLGTSAYYNLWLRWGNAYVFLELNYIAWREQIVNPDDEEDVHKVGLESIGFSVGFPLIKFL